MKLSFHRGAEPNFGDELNDIVWRSLLPAGLLDDDDSEVLVGIGSIINTEHPAHARKHVLGSGYGGYTRPPDLADGTWVLHWVRGPRTAARFGIDPALVITDSAILLAAMDLPAPVATGGTVFMPHLDSLQRGAWPHACALAGVTFLDPRAPVEDLLGQIAGARLVITEAMHGAIVADTLRVPWIGIRPVLPLHRDKWHDWAQSLSIDLRPVPAQPSSLREVWAAHTGLDARGRRTRLVLDGPLAAPGRLWVSHRAARFLQDLATTGDPQLSDAAQFDRALDRSLTALDRFVRGRAPAHPAVAARGTV